MWNKSSAPTTGIQFTRNNYTAERVMAHIESFRINTVDTRAAYVTISRARSHAALYTDSRARFAEALGLRDRAQVRALDEIMGRDMSMLK